MSSASDSFIGVLLAGFVGLFAYAWQERIRRNSLMVEKRKELYETLLRSLFELLIAKTGEARSELITQVEKGWLFASDEVLEACYKYLEIYTKYFAASENVVAQLIEKDSQVRKDFEIVIAELFWSMRHDLKGSKTKDINIKWALNHVRIYDWGIISKNY